MKTTKIILITAIACLSITCSKGLSDAEAKAYAQKQSDSISNALSKELESAMAKERTNSVSQQSQESDNKNTKTEWNYSGVIDKYAIKAFLNYGEGTNSEGTGALEIPITGYYFYESQNIKIPLEGSSNGAGMIYLVAHTNSGDENFEGQFTGSMLEDFEGTWSSKKKSLTFKLISKK